MFSRASLIQSELLSLLEKGEKQFSCPENLYNFIYLKVHISPLDNSNRKQQQQQKDIDIDRKKKLAVNHDRSNWDILLAHYPPSAVCLGKRNFIFISPFSSCLTCGCICGSRGKACRQGRLWAMKAPVCGLRLPLQSSQHQRAGFYGSGLLFPSVIRNFTSNLHLQRDTFTRSELSHWHPASCSKIVKRAFLQKKVLSKKWVLTKCVARVFQWQVPLFLLVLPGIPIPLSSSPQGCSSVLTC